MNEEPRTPGAGNPEAWSAPPPSETPGDRPSAAPPSGTSAPAEASSSGNAPKRALPSWLPLAAAAVVPAVIVGIVVFLVSGGSGSGGSRCDSALDGFVRLSLSQGERIESTCGLPQGFPRDIPVYRGASLDGGFAIKSSQGTTFIVVYSTSGSKSDVYDFYLSQLDRDPWQIELSREADDFTGMQFSRPDSADIQGSVTINHSSLDNRTAIFVFLLDSSLTSRTSTSGAGVPSTSLKLPPNFPSDVPIFRGKQESIVLDTYFQREAGQNAFLVSFLTKDADVDVINFYTQEFQKRGWAVRDGATQPGDFALVIEFDDNKPTKEVRGSIRADVYSEDASYTEVNLIVQVSASRGRGN